MKFRLIENDCLAALQAAGDEKVHAIVTDPPYGIEFMGSTWDSPTRMLGHIDDKPGDGGMMDRKRAKGEKSPGYENCNPQLFQQWVEAWGREALRVLKPGGHIISFASPRMYHRLAAGLEDAGFELRDQLMWLYGSGMPKGRSLVPAIEGLVGADEAAKWAGWQTCLKPMFEPILLARKPLVGTVAENIVLNGLGAMNVDACAVGNEDRVNPPGMAGWNGYRHDGAYQETDDVPAKARKGRMPGNVIIDAEAAAIIDAEAHGSKNPSRFFYCPKAGKEEKLAGLEGAAHPTTKPLALMGWLIDLIAPEASVILDPFMGSGTTGIAALQRGHTFIGIERDPGYMQIARARIDYHAPDAVGSYVPAPPYECDGKIDSHAAEELALVEQAPFANCRDRCEMVGMGRCNCA